LVSDGRKISKFGLSCAEVETFAQNSRLLPLCHIGYEVADKWLLSKFVERWHRDTNTFYLPDGEMTITLDDVSCILHIPIVGEFLTYITLELIKAADLLVELLGSILAM